LPIAAGANYFLKNKPAQRLHPPLRRLRDIPNVPRIETEINHKAHFANDNPFRGILPSARRFFFRRHLCGQNAPTISPSIGRMQPMAAIVGR
jgi:hypothetical protein